MFTATAVPERKQQLTFTSKHLILMNFILLKQKTQKKTKNDFSPESNKNDNPIDKKCQP